MCILFIAVQQRTDYPLIIAANRDEFHQRPTQSSHWWKQPDNILAGKDLEAGGTWMGITTSGHFAALTNIRDPARIKTDAKSRGELVVNALVEDQDEMHERLANTKSHYNGYNLLYGTVDHLKVYNNFTNELEAINKGVHGLSNAALNSPWPKTTKGMKALEDYCQHADNIDQTALFQILRDDVKAPDHALPNTGVPYDWEKQLSSAFIITPEYGTRSSTVLLVSDTGRVEWYERVFDNAGNVTGEQKFEFDLTQ